jgi:hypothetical protein
MLPCLLLSSRLTAGFSTSPFLRARDLAWQFLSSPVDIGVVASLSEEFQDAGPNSEDFGAGLYVSCAISASESANLLLDFMRDTDPEHMAHIGELATDCIYMCLDEVVTPDVITDQFVQSVFAHPVMVDEFRRQDGDIEFLRNLNEEFGTEAVSALQARARHQKPVLPRCAEWDSPALRKKSE